jgi:hypothetical protein
VCVGGSPPTPTPTHTPTHPHTHTPTPCRRSFGLPASIHTSTRACSHSHCGMPRHADHACDWYSPPLTGSRHRAPTLTSRRATESFASTAHPQTSARRQGLKLPRSSAVRKTSHVRFAQCACMCHPCSLHCPLHCSLHCPLHCPLYWHDLFTMRHSVTLNGHRALLFLALTHCLSLQSPTRSLAARARKVRATHPSHCRDRSLLSLYSLTNALTRRAHSAMRLFCSNYNSSVKASALMEAPTPTHSLVLLAVLTHSCAHYACSLSSAFVRPIVPACRDQLWWRHRRRLLQRARHQVQRIAALHAGWVLLPPRLPCNAVHSKGRGHWSNPQSHWHRAGCAHRCACCSLDCVLAIERACVVCVLERCPPNTTLFTYAVCDHMHVLL